jgi:small-conductance mechanosensitive channel
MKEILKTEIISIGSFSLTIEKILSVVLIIFFSYFFIKIISAIIIHSFKKKNKADGRHLSIIQLIKYLIWSLAFVYILQSLGLNITFLIASSAALLVGIGLGLQDIFKDFVSGITLLTEGTIKVDDIVEVDGMVVKVNEISLRTSIVSTREDNVVIIPNHKFIEEKIINWTANKLPSRFTIEVAVDYLSDEHLVEKVLIECALKHKDVLSDKEFGPSVRLSNFGNSSLDFQLIFYSYNLFRIESVKSRLRFLILEAFRKDNITIPFPQRVIHYSNKE